MPGPAGAYDHSVGLVLCKWSFIIIPIRQPAKAAEASLSVLRIKLYSLLAKYCFDCISMMFSNMLFCQKDRKVRLNGALFLGM